jgi:hypothetical protein
VAFCRSVGPKGFPLIVRVSYIWLLVLVGLVVAAAPVHALVNGGCKASATASRSGTVDLTTARVWHVTHADELNGAGTAPTSQKFAQLKVVMFGIGLPLLDQSGNSRSGTAGPYKISDYDRYTRVLSVAGTSTNCDGTILIIVDDVNPLSTLAGVLGAIAAVLGIAGLVASMFLSPSGSSRVVAMIVGLLGGLGVGAVLQQEAILDPGNSLGLLLPVGGAVIGLFLPGVLRRPGVAAP